jgi:hypothetical protein
MPPLTGLTLFLEFSSTNMSRLLALGMGGRLGLIWDRDIFGFTCFYRAEPRPGIGSSVLLTGVEKGAAFFGRNGQR